MDFTKLCLNDNGLNYSYVDSSNLDMTVLSNFLSNDADYKSTQNYPSWQEWALNDTLGMDIHGTITILEKRDDYILLSDIYSKEDDPIELKMSRPQFVTLLDEWQEKICKKMPHDVTIIYENNKYSIETKKVMINSFMKLQLDRDFSRYSNRQTSTLKMCILSHFFQDIRASQEVCLFWKEWALNDALGMGVGTNIMFLEKEGDYIFLTDQLTRREDPIELKISRKQFVTLLDDWQKKVCETKPDEVIITHKNDEFIIETND